MAVALTPQTASLKPLKLRPILQNPTRFWPRKSSLSLVVRVEAALIGNVLFRRSEWRRPNESN